MPITKPPPENKPASWYSIKNAVNDEPPIVFIYDEIGYWGVTAEDFVNEINNLDTDNMTVRINTPGGSVFDGMAMYNALRRHKAKVTTQVDGLAASMGSVIALAGDVVNMAENSYFMIHNPWGGCFGESKDLRKYADRLDEMRDQIANIYEAKTGLDRSDILQAMDDETWYTGTTASAAGFIDNLTESLDASACYHGIEAAKHFGKSPIKIAHAAVDNSPSQLDRKTHLTTAKLALLRLENNL